MFQEVQLQRRSLRVDAPAGVRTTLVAGLLVTFLASAAQVAGPDASAGSGASPVAGRLTGAQAFDILRGLAGTWEGTAGDADAGSPARVDYRVASGGSVVMETLFPGDAHEMISMYHLADGELVMTHYCSLGNQPHMRLDRAHSSPARLVFVFDGGTNFDPAYDGHIHAGEIRIGSDGTLAATWAYYEEGEQRDTKDFQLTRKR